MLYLRERDSSGKDATLSLTLTFEQRSKSRFRVRLDDGTEAAVELPRGGILRGGDRLAAEDGRVVVVRAADELVSTTRTADPVVLARTAYHLGNRHIPVQIEPGWLRYQHDHVLDDLVRGLGLEVVVEQAPFEPEAGSYAGHGGARAGHAHGGSDHGHHG